MMMNENLDEPLLLEERCTDDEAKSNECFNHLEKEKEASSSIDNHDLLENSNNDNDEIRVAINPSMLQRCLSSEYYYFFDDICTPKYEQILLWEQDDEQQKQQKNLRRVLLDNEKDEEQGKLKHQDGSIICDDDDMLKHVWIRLIARLNDMQNEYHQKNRDGYWRAFIIWFVLNTFLVTEVVNGDYYYGNMESNTDFMNLGFICIVLLMTVLNVCPLIVNLSNYQAEGGGGEGEHIIQSIVDQAAKEFDNLGYHIDLVKSNTTTNLLLLSPTCLFHPHLHIRITTSKASSTTTKNQAKLYQYQQEALFDYQDWVLLKKQELRLRLLKKQGATKQTSSSDEDYDDDSEIIILCLKIHMKTLASWKPIIIFMTVFFGFIYLTSIFMNFFAPMIYYGF